MYDCCTRWTNNEQRKNSYRSVPISLFIHKINLLLFETQCIKLNKQQNDNSNGESKEPGQRKMRKEWHILYMVQQVNFVRNYNDKIISNISLKYKNSLIHFLLLFLYSFHPSSYRGISSIRSQFTWYNTHGCQTKRFRNTIAQW